MTHLATADRPVAASSAERLPDLCELAENEAGKAVVGCRGAVRLMLVAAVCGGHVLLEGPPGTAKTLLSAAIARILGVSFKRVQFTPDTTPAEVLGQTTRKLGETTFEPGAVFTHVLLADEINRTPPRTQAALLEAMQERHVTVDGRTYWLEAPFFVIATQNSFEHGGVFPLPDSQLDRFLFRIELRYPGEADEVAMLALPHRGISPDVIGDVQPVFGRERFLRVQEEVGATAVPEQVARDLVAIVRRTRSLSGVVLGASPRAAIHLLGAAKASARLAGRTVVTTDDVRLMAPHVLGHRLLLDGVTADSVIASALGRDPA